VTATVKNPDQARGDVAAPRGELGGDPIARFDYQAVPESTDDRRTTNDLADRLAHAGSVLVG
jgi:hypothetical protein